MDYIIVPIIWIVLIVLLIAFIASNIVIVPQAKAYVIERLGTYRDMEVIDDESDKSNINVGATPQGELSF